MGESPAVKSSLPQQDSNNQQQTSAIVALCQPLSVFCPESQKLSPEVNITNVSTTKTSPIIQNATWNNPKNLEASAACIRQNPFLPSTSTTVVPAVRPVQTTQDIVQSPSPKNSSATFTDINNVSLAQLLSSGTKVPQLHRPTPIHPLRNSQHIYKVLGRTTEAFPKVPQISKPDDSLEVPLDLSHGVARQQSVIQSPATPSSSQQQQQQQQQQPNTFLPTCVNPNLNTNLIALKFGAASGPNRMSYPREFKLLVINYYYSNGQNKYRTCKEFQITKSMLNGWLQKIDKIRQSRPGSLKSGRSGRRPQFPAIEKQLFNLYSAHLGTGKKVGNRWIRETARNLAKQQCSEQELAGMCQFSERWLSNFKKRYHINLNRDWTSGPNSLDSTGSAGSSTSEEALSEKTADQQLRTDENTDSDGDSDSMFTLIDVEDSSISSNDSFPLNPTNPITADQTHIHEILNKPGQLPIQAFYELFPWLCRKNQVNGQPGRRGRKVQFPGVERVLFERLKQQQMKGERISNRWLQQQARELATRICPEVLQEATKSARCLFSEHWLHNFKKRYGVSLKQNTVPLPRNGVTTDAANEKSSDVVLQTDINPDPAPKKPEITAVEPNLPPKRSELAAALQLQNWFVSRCYEQPMVNTELPPTVDHIYYPPNPPPALF